MKIDDVTLRAYVDGELSPEQRDRVEVALAHSEELREQVQALRASCLPYRMAFDRQPMPPVPDSLKKQVEAWASLAKAPAAAQPASMGRRRWLGMGMAAAAAFTAGVFVPMAWKGGSGDMTESHWVQAIAVYQSLYARETVEPLADDAARTRQVLANFKAREGLAVTVPDLRAQGLVFKRIQPLAVGNEPLLQMVFLPPQGKPVALCVLAMRHQPDARVATRRIEGMEVSTWQRGGLAYVLVADMPSAQVALLADRLANDEFPALHRAVQQG